MTATFSCDPGWVLNGENCFWQGIMSDRGADFTETMSRNCGANMDFADPARCKPRIRRATAVQNFNPPAPPPPSNPPAPPPPSNPPPDRPPNAPTAGCGNSYIHIVPQFLRNAQGQSNQLHIDFHPDISMPSVDGNPIDAKRDINWFVNGNFVVQNPWMDFGVLNATATPGIYRVDLEMGTFIQGCPTLRDSITIEVTPAENPVPPPEPPPGGCPKGKEWNINYGDCVLKRCPDGNFVDDSGECPVPPPAPPAPPPVPPPPTCMDGFHLGADGKTCEKTDLNNNCPPNTYFSAGICTPIPGSGLAFDNSYGGYNRLSANYQTASSYGDVFKTPETDSKPAAAGISTNTILIALAAVAGIGGIYYMSTTNVRRRYF